MRAFARGFAAGAGGAVGAAVALIAAATVVGALAQAQAKTKVREWTERMQAQIDLLRAGECRDSWHGNLADGAPNSCPTCGNVD